MQIFMDYVRIKGESVSFTKKEENNYGFFSKVAISSSILHCIGNAEIFKKRKQSFNRLLITDNPSSNFLLQFCDVFSNLIASIFSFAHYKHVHGNTAFH